MLAAAVLGEMAGEETTAGADDAAGTPLPSKPGRRPPTRLPRGLEAATEEDDRTPPAALVSGSAVGEETPPTAGLEEAPAGADDEKRASRRSVSGIAEADVSPPATEAADEGRRPPARLLRAAALEPRLGSEASDDAGIEALRSRSDGSAALGVSDRRPSVGRPADTGRDGDAGRAVEMPAGSEDAAGTPGEEAANDGVGAAGELKRPPSGFVRRPLS